MKIFENLSAKEAIKYLQSNQNEIIEKILIHEFAQPKTIIEQIDTDSFECRDDWEIRHVPLLGTPELIVDDQIISLANQGIFVRKKVQIAFFFVISLRENLYSLELSQTKIEMLSPATGDSITSCSITMDNIEDLERQYRQVSLVIRSKERRRIQKQIELLQQEIQSL